MTDINQIAITSPDGRKERLERLRALFPDLFDGEGQLNEKALRALISDEVGVATERFTFEWAGKQKSKRFAFIPSKATLQFDAERSVNSDGSPNKAGQTLTDNTSENLIIEGDNLEVLKLLQASYFEKVQCIYIDPPYNTGNDFIYPDDFSQSKKAYWETNGDTRDGIKLVAVPESSGRRHSKWLNMMQSRLLLARNLLKETGVIFISIDDVEVHNLRMLANEIFGETNFIAQLVWHKKYTRSNDAKFFSDNHDHILIYAKRKEKGVISLLPRSKEADAAYTNPDNHPKGVWKATPLHAKSGAKGGFSYTFSNGVSWKPPKGTFARYSTDTLTSLDKDDEIYFGGNGDAIPQKKSFLSEVKAGLTPVTILPYSEVGHTHESNEELKALKLDGIFQNPKPTRLVRRVIDLGIPMNDNEIILDFFSGSGTTGHATMLGNLEQSRKTKFILVQIPEITDEKLEAYKAGYKKISDITIERVKRAGAKIRKENPQTTIDTGFRVFKLSDSNFPQNLFSPDPAKSEEENLKVLKAHLAKAAQVRLFDEDEFSNLVTEISLKNGFGLFYELRPVTELSKNRVYRLIGNDKSALLCLDNDLHDETIEGLKPFKDEQLIVSKSSLDTTKKFSLQTEFKDNLWVV